MKLACIVLVAVALSSCSPRPASRARGGHEPRVGDSAEHVMYWLGISYFESSGPGSGVIQGYLWDPLTNTYSGFGPGMLDETMPGIHVVLLYFERGYLRDIIRVEGGVTDEMLSGHSQRFFLQKWSEEEDGGGKRQASED